MADLDAIVRVYGEMADADHPDWAESKEEVEDDLATSFVDLARDSILVLDGDRPVAHGLAYCSRQGETFVRSYLFGGVVPAYRRRGIGRELLDRQIARAREQLAEVPLDLPRWIIADGKASGDPAPLFARKGLEPLRWYFKMERDLAEPIPELALPEGLRLAPWPAERDMAALEAKNAAFRDHWGSQPTLAEQWAQMTGAELTRRDLSFLVVDDEDRIVGLLLSLANEEDWARQGYSSSYIQIIGVLRDWRRRGVAPALIAQALAATKAAGIARAQLDVDAENPTGALRLYEGMGFRQQERSAMHVLVIG